MERARGLDGATTTTTGPGGDGGPTVTRPGRTHSSPWRKPRRKEERRCPVAREGHPTTLQSSYRQKFRQRTELSFASRGMLFELAVCEVVAMSYVLGLLKSQLGYTKCPGGSERLPSLTVPGPRDLCIVLDVVKTLILVAEAQPAYTGGASLTRELACSATLVAVAGVSGMLRSGDVEAVALASAVLAHPCRRLLPAFGDRRPYV